MIIGITGGMGSGKSTLANVLKEKGFSVFDADAIYKELTGPGEALVLKLEELFGRDVSDENHSLNRARLSEAAFSSEENIRLLNETTHKAVKDEIERRVSESGSDLIALDIPLLFESGSDAGCDEVWLVVAPLKERLQRIVMRDGISEDEALKRISHQMSDEDKIKLSDVVIYNDSTYEELVNKIDEIVKERLKL